MTVSSKPVAVLTLVATLLSGCATLEPAYHRPVLPTPKAFPEAAGAPASSAAASVNWRQFFLDPKLRSVVDLALKNNRDLRVAIANIEAARAQYRVQRAQLLPTINASAGVTYGRESTASFGAVTPGEPADISEHQFTTSLGASSYEVDLFGKVRSLSKSAREQYLATEAARRATQISLIAEVANDYLTLAADKALLKAAQDTLVSARASLDITQKRFDHGVASELDVRQAQTVVAQARADVANAVTLAAQAKNALDLVVGAPAPETLLPGDQDDQIALLTDLPAGLPSDVLLSRPDVVEAEHQLKAANAKIGAARAAFFPQVTLTASGGTTSGAVSSLFSGPAAIWSFAPQVTLPIFAGGANRASLDYAKAEQRVAVAQYEKAIQSAFRDVADALARRATIDEQLSAQQANVTASADSLRLSQARYDRGGDTYLNLLIAQRTLYAAQQSLISARQTRASNLVTLYTALGGGGLD
jgi:multidrug efflux system outer membrane protein